MSGIFSSATIALTTVVTVFAASFPEVTHAIAPVLESGNEYAAYSLALLVSIPGIALLTVLAGASRD